MTGDKDPRTPRGPSVDEEGTPAGDPRPAEPDPPEADGSGAERVPGAEEALDDDPGSRPRVVVPEPEEGSTATRRPWRRVGASALGVLAIAVTTGTVVLLPDVLPPSVEPVAAARSIAVTPGAERWVCPSPARLTDAEAVGDDQFGSAPVDTVSRLSAFVRPTGASVELRGIDGGDPVSLHRGDEATTASTGDLDDAGVLTVTPPADAESIEVVAGVSSLITAGDLRGLVAATCAPPSVSHWLVGGATEVGSSARLVLQNPGETPATVRVEAWGPAGPVALGSGATQVVAPGTQTVTLLEASAPEQSQIVVHVTSTGAMIGAYVQHNTLDGLVPLGVDDIVAGAEPSTRSAVSGVETSGLAADDPHAPRLRLLAPSGAATAHVVAFGPDGQVRLRGAEDVALQPGVVTEISLGGLAAGTYTIAVESDAPVVAGAVTDRQGEPAPDLLHEERQYDRTWIAARPLVDPGAEASPGLGGIPLVPDATATVTIAAVPVGRLDPLNDTAPTGEFVGTLTAYGQDGDPLGTRDVTVDAGTVLTLDAADIAPDAGQAPAVVTLSRADGTTGVVPLWSALAAASTGEGDPTLVSALLPALPVDAGTTVTVHADDTLGLVE